MRCDSDHDMRDLLVIVIHLLPPSQDCSALEAPVRLPPNHYCSNINCKSVAAPHSAHRISPRSIASCSRSTTRPETRVPMDGLAHFPCAEQELSLDPRCVPPPIDSATQPLGNAGHGRLDPMHHRLRRRARRNRRRIRLPNVQLRNSERANVRTNQYQL